MAADAWKQCLTRGATGSGLGGLEGDLGAECAVYGAEVGDLDEPSAVLIVERTLDVDLPADTAEHSDVLLGLCAVLRVDPVVAGPDRRTVAGQARAGGVHPEGHR